MKLGIKEMFRFPLRCAHQARRGFDRVRTWWAHLHAWPWAIPLARVALMSAGLVVLALIGNSARGSVPASAGARAPEPSATTIATVAVSSNTGDAAPMAEPIAARTAGLPRARATPDDPVVLNMATIEDLERLPGIGPKKAASIVQLRQRLGRFRNVEDLLKVKGIGRATLRKLRPLVRIDPAIPVDAGAPS